MSKLVPITEPDEVTGALRLLKIYQRQREEANGQVSHEDLMEESNIVIRLLEVDCRMRLNIAGEAVRKSLERQ